jgi:hypothetical protein
VAFFAIRTQTEAWRWSKLEGSSKVGNFCKEEIETLKPGIEGESEEIHMTPR